MLPLHDHPEPALLRRSRRGDREAFRRLLEPHLPALFALCLARTDSRERARELCLEALRDLSRRLFLCREGTWFHRFAMQITRARLDRNLPPNLVEIRPGGTGLEGLPLHLREVACLASIEDRLPFPAIEYLGLGGNAYEARRARARAHFEGGSPPAPLGPEEASRLLAALTGELGPSRNPRAPSLPRLPLPLAFLLALGLSGTLVGLLFRPPSEPRAASDRSAPLPSPRAGKPSAPAGIHLTWSPGTASKLLAPGHWRLDAGTLLIEHEGFRPVRIEIGDRTYKAGRGRHRLEAGPSEFRIERLEGLGALLRSGKDPSPGESRRKVWTWSR